MNIRELINRKLFVHKGYHKGALGDVVDVNIETDAIYLRTSKGEIQVHYLDCFPELPPKAEDSFAAAIAYDQVQKPAHYAQDRTIEPISVIEDWFPDGTDGAFHKGNALKYLSRAGRKEYHGKTMIESEIIDLEKQVWYVQRRIAILRASQEKNVEIASLL